MGSRRTLDDDERAVGAHLEPVDDGMEDPDCELVHLVRTDQGFHSEARHVDGDRVVDGLEPEVEARVRTRFDVGDDGDGLVDAQSEILDLVDAEAEIGGERRGDDADGRRMAVVERQVELDDVDLGCDVAVLVQVSVHGAANLPSHLLGESSPDPRVVWQVTTSGIAPPVRSPLTHRSCVVPVSLPSVSMPTIHAPNVRVPSISVPSLDSPVAASRELIGSIAKTADAIGDTVLDTVTNVVSDGVGALSGVMPGRSRRRSSRRIVVASVAAAAALVAVIMVARRRSAQRTHDAQDALSVDLAERAERRPATGQPADVGAADRRDAVHAAD